MTHDMQKVSSELYEQDFNLWIHENVEHLTHGDFKNCDINNIIEELKSMGNSELNELESRLITLLGHLRKYKYQPIHRSSGLRGTIRHNRIKINGLLRKSPSLKNKFIDLLNDDYERNAIGIFTDETGLNANILSLQPEFTLEQILDDEFLPGYL